MTQWIFIRGLQREAGHFGDFGGAFTGALPDARVEYLDLPGNGENHRVRTPLSVQAMTEQLRAQAQARGQRRPYLLALSLGGMVACDWAQRYPHELSGIVLVNTSFGGMSPPWQRFQFRSVPTMLAIARERDLVRREKRMMTLASARPDLYEVTAARWAGIARARPVSRWSSLRQLIAGARFRPPPTRPSVPHLLLVGQNDRVCDPSCSRAIAERWGGPPESHAVHPTAGHDLTLDAPGWMIDKITAWLAATKER
jgi:pimeloyl-[acyl-carrier protein] methyl ester esterase